MKNLKNIEMINLSMRDGKQVALISYQDPTKPNDDPNDGYSFIEVPVNLREVQTSIRGNRLVNQSIKQCIDCVPEKSK